MPGAMPNVSAVPSLFQDVAREPVYLRRPAAGPNRRLAGIERLVHRIQRPLLILVRLTENERAFQLHDIPGNDGEDVEGDDFPAPDVLPGWVEMRGERVQARVAVGVSTGQGAGQQRGQRS